MLHIYNTLLRYVGGTYISQACSCMLQPRNRRTYASRFTKWKHVLSIMSSNLSPTHLPTTIGSDCINAAICISCITISQKYQTRSNEVPKYIPVYNAMTPENSKNRPARSIPFQKSVDKLFLTVSSFSTIGQHNTIPNQCRGISISL